MSKAHMADLDAFSAKVNALEAKLEESTARCAASDKEIGNLQLKLDSAKNGWNECEAKLQDATAVVRAAHNEIVKKNTALQLANDEADKLRNHVSELQEDLEEKEVLLHTIHTASKQVADAVAAPTRRPADQRCVHFDELPTTQPQSDTEDVENWRVEEPDARDNEEGSLAVAISRPAQTRPLSRARRGAHDHAARPPVVEEPSDTESDDVEFNRRAFHRKGGTRNARSLRITGMKRDELTGRSRETAAASALGDLSSRPLQRSRPKRSRVAAMTGAAIAEKSSNIKGFQAPNSRSAALFSLFNHLQEASPSST